MLFIINNKLWKIKIVSRTNKKLRNPNNSFALGVCDNNDRCIYISNELSSKKFKQVLYHEITHALIFSYNIHIPYRQEELFADLMATYGAEVIYLTNKIFYAKNKNRGA